MGGKPMPINRCFKGPVSITLAFVMLIAFAAVPVLGGQTAVASSGWEQQDSGTTHLLTGVSAADADTAWAVGQAGVILKTTDGGATWTPQTPGSTYWPKGVEAVNEDVAWVYGGIGAGSVYRTVDGGATWQLSCQLPSSMYCAGMSAVGPDIAWLLVHGNIYIGDLVLQFNNILKTTDGGATWSTLYYGPLATLGFPLGGVSAPDPSTAWAVNYHDILKTADGTNWVKQYDTSRALFSVSAVDARTVWVAGDGVVLKTGDGGAIWTQVFDRPASIISVYGLTASDADVAVAAGAEFTGDGWKGVIYRTIDGGANWTQQATDSTPNIYALCSVDANTYWAVGLNGMILHTADGGGLPAPDKPRVASITPTSGVENTVVDVTNLAGTDFQEGATVRIEKTGTTVNATDVNVVSSTQITCKLNLTGVPLGKYDVVVRNPDAQEGMLTQGFSVTNVCGGGAAVSLSIFGIMMGLMSLAGSAGLRRRFRKKN